MAIRPDDHRPLLDRILSDYGLAPSALAIVPDVQEWSRGHREEEPEPFRQAKWIRFADGTFHIAMADVLTDDMINGGKGAMDFRGMASSVETLDTDMKYLVHLLPHEIAGHVLRTGEQIPRSQWAFKQLSKYVPNAEP
ncbi:MAG TPA: hypothetical protein VFB93_18385 [Burkholderiales bacterium]|nr:hypothetical protein [Burkholderiales bacterium]